MKSQQVCRIPMPIKILILIDEIHTICHIPVKYFTLICIREFYFTIVIPISARINNIGLAAYELELSVIQTAR